MFAASISLARTSVAGLVKEDGMLFFPIPIFGLHSSCHFPTSLVDVVLEMGGYDIDQEFFEPLNGVLNRCKSAKNLSRSAFSESL
jgi:dynactin 1